MKILILEDEIYLAQKVSSRLVDEGHTCEHYTSFGEVDKTKKYDTVLLSMNLHTTNCEDVIKFYKDTIIYYLSHI
jgi:DNA-binding response OmpR family regulator